MWLRSCTFTSFRLLEKANKKGRKLFFESHCSRYSATTSTTGPIETVSAAAQWRGKSGTGYGEEIKINGY